MNANECSHAEHIEFGLGTSWDTLKNDVVVGSMKAQLVVLDVEVV
jgi:hypothetical protein